MIFYFSGTGNSRYAAERIARMTGDELVCMNEEIKSNTFRPFSAGEQLVFVTPTYAWRMPRIVTDWILHTDFKGRCKAWFVLTCGAEIGNAAKYNRQICEQKHFTYMGTAQILLPENYIAMFNAPEWEEAKSIVARAEPDILAVGERIRAGQSLPKPRNNLYDRFTSSIVNPIFYKLFVKAKAFCFKDSCVGCGECERLCPLNNITLKDGKPEWGKNCTHCMACICRCPTAAIEYGKKSIDKPRYICRAEREEN